MSNNFICAFCKHFKQQETLRGNASKCEITNRFVHEENTCVDFKHMYEDDDVFYHDINDDIDYYD